MIKRAAAMVSCEVKMSLVMLKKVVAVVTGLGNGQQNEGVETLVDQDDCSGQLKGILLKILASMVSWKEKMSLLKLKKEVAEVTEAW